MPKNVSNQVNVLCQKIRNLNNKINNINVEGGTLDIPDNLVVEGNLIVNQNTTLQGDTVIEGDTVVNNIFNNTVDNPLNLYVATTGSDTLNDGLTPATPFRTIQHAFDIGGTSLLSGRLTINVADGVYDENVIVSDLIGAARDVGGAGALSPLPFGNNVIRLLGNISTPANVTIRGNTSGIGLEGIITHSDSTTTLVIEGFTLDNSGNSANSVGILILRAKVLFDNIDITGNIQIGIRASRFSVVDTVIDPANNKPGNMTWSVTSTGVLADLQSSITLGGIPGLASLTLDGPLSSGGIQLLNNSYCFLANLTLTMTLNSVNSSVGIGLQDRSFMSIIMVGPATLSIIDAGGGLSQGGAFLIQEQSVLNVSSQADIVLNNCFDVMTLLTGGTYIDSSLTDYDITGGTPRSGISINMSETSNFWSQSVTLKAEPFDTSDETNLEFRYGIDRRYIQKAVASSTVSINVNEYIGLNNTSVSELPIYDAGVDSLVTQLSVFHGTASSGGGTDDYEVYRFTSGTWSATGLVLSVANGLNKSKTTYGSNSFPILPDDMLAVRKIGAAATSGLNVFITIIIEPRSAYQ